MDFNFQPYQLVFVLIFSLIAFLFYEVEKTWFRVLLVIVAVIIFAFNPVRFKQEGMRSIETFSQTEAVVPDRVVVDEKSFEESQKDRLTRLIKESEEKRKNEKETRN